MSSSNDERLACAQSGDLALLAEGGRKTLFIKLRPGRVFETHQGILSHDDLIGSPWGSYVETHLGHSFLLLQPSLNESVLHMRRISQLIYPKESGYILLQMNIGPGSRVIEAGTGSGGLTLVLAHAVSSEGHVFSYDVRQDMQQMARRNLEKSGLEDRVTFFLQDVTEGFDQTGVDALFLDLPSPWECLEQARAALVNGGFFGAILPTTNQVTRLLGAFPRHSFGHIAVEEILLRPYKPVATRLRPQDQMVAHTGFLIFARALIPPRDQL
jgi:tRNA (adenine57-N1/adenine58-N1)-methyltransferase